MDWISAEELRTRKIEEHKGKFRIEDCYGLVVWKKKKRNTVLGLVNVKLSKLVVVCTEENQEKHGLKERKVSKDIAKDRNA